MAASVTQKAVNAGDTANHVQDTLARVVANAPRSLPMAASVIQKAVNAGDIASHGQDTLAGMVATVPRSLSTAASVMQKAVNAGDTANHVQDTLAGVVATVPRSLPTAASVMQKAANAMDTTTTATDSAGSMAGSLQKLEQMRDRLQKASSSEALDGAGKELDGAELQPRGPEDPVHPETESKVDPIFSHQGQFVDAADKGLSDVDMPHFTRRLEELCKGGHSQVTLDLSNNQFSSVGLRHLVEIIERYPNFVAVLILDGNEFGDEGAVVIAEFARFLVATTTLSLRKTSMSGDGIIPIVKAFCEFGGGALECLDLTGNPVNEEDVKLIVDDVKHLESGPLKVDISVCGLSPDALAGIPRRLVVH
jgi:hypothetical protein